MKAVSVGQMRKLDRRTIEEAKVPGFSLMERAGFGCGEKIIDFIEDRIKINNLRRFVILAGKGNNGGDAYVVARYLYENTDIDIIIYSICDIDELSDDSKKHAGLIIGNVDYSVKKKIKPKDFKKGDIIIDGLLGTGIKGSIRSNYKEWIMTVNSLFLTVISIDVPSGLDGDKGCFKDHECIMADMTVTVGLPKYGLVRNRGIECCGLLRYVDIGIPGEYIDEEESDLEIFFDCDAAKYLTRLPVESYKNSVGSVLIIGGSKEYYGAPFLAALTAQRSGAGMVRVAVPESIEKIPDTALSLIVKKIKDNGDGYFCLDSLEELKPLIDKSNVIVLGPGIGTERDTFLFVREILRIRKTLILDADALNIIAESPEIYHGTDSNILTPHHGEMKRLLEAFGLERFNDHSREDKAEALAECLDATIVFKGARTVIASPDGQITVNSSGCPALATAGSGDSLTGIIAAFSAKAHEDYYMATAAAVFIHGMTGEISPFGNRGFIADDIHELIPEAMLRISAFA